MWNHDDETKYYEEEASTSAAKNQRRKHGALDNTPRYAYHSGESALGNLVETGMDMLTETKADHSVQSSKMNTNLWEMAQSHGQAGTGSSGFGGCGKVPEDESAEEIAQIDTYNHDAALRLGQHG